MRCLRCALTSSAPLSTGRCLRVVYSASVTADGGVSQCLVEEWTRRRVKRLCVSCAACRPVRSSCRLFTSFVSPLPLLYSCETNFASRVCRVNLLVDQYVWCAQPSACTCSCNPLGPPVYSFMVALSSTLIAETCHIPLLCSCSTPIARRPPRWLFAAATGAPLR